MKILNYYANRKPLTPYGAMEPCPPATKQFMVAEEAIIGQRA